MKHGGSAPQIRARAEVRAWAEFRLWRPAARDMARRLQAFDARLRADPEAVRAEALAWLAEVCDRLRQFRREHGHRPRSSELALILDGQPGWRRLERYAAAGLAGAQLPSER